MASNLLVVDAGNTNIVLGVYRGEDLVSSWRLATARERTADEYGILARQLVGDALHAGLEGAIVASVVPPLNSAIGNMLQKYFGVEPLFVEPGVKTGIAIHTDNPLEVGADRIVNCVAAHHAYGGSTVIVDFGTATTFDAVSPKGEYLGGSILPGIEISMDALFARADRLWRVELVEPRSVIGKSTTEALQSGAIYGFAAQVDGICRRMEDELGESTVVATGGLSGLISRFSNAIQHIDPWLTLHGLRLVYERNQ